MMRNFLLSTLVLGLVAGSSATRAMAAQTTDKTSPSYDMKAQSLIDLDDMHKKFVTLAEAIPADKFTWRPGEGVRSISEAFLHVADMNFQMRRKSEPHQRPDTRKRATRNPPRIRPRSSSN